MFVLRDISLFLLERMTLHRCETQPGPRNYACKYLNLDRPGRPHWNDRLSRLLYSLPCHARHSVASDGLCAFRPLRRAYPSCSRHHRHDPRSGRPRSRIPTASTYLCILVRISRSHVHLFGSVLRRPPAQPWIRSRYYSGRELLHDSCTPPKSHLLQKVQDLYLMLIVLSAVPNS